MRLGTFTHVYPYAPAQAVVSGGATLRVATDGAGGEATVRVFMPEDDGPRALHLNVLRISEAATTLDSSAILSRRHVARNLPRRKRPASHRRCDGPVTTPALRARFDPIDFSTAGATMLDDSNGPFGGFSKVANAHVSADGATIATDEGELVTITWLGVRAKTEAQN